MNNTAEFIDDYSKHFVFVPLPVIDLPPESLKIYCILKRRMNYSGRRNRAGLEHGQALFSVAGLKDESGLTNKVIRNGLNRLKEAGMVILDSKKFSGTICTFPEVFRENELRAMSEGKEYGQ